MFISKDYDLIYIRRQQLVGTIFVISYLFTEQSEHFVNKKNPNIV